MWSDRTLLPTPGAPTVGLWDVAHAHGPPHPTAAAFPRPEGVLGFCVHPPSQGCAGYKQRPSYSHPSQLVQGTEYRLDEFCINEWTIEILLC